ncbi:hypothetical protein AG1IA_02719 [Rhizoctonia solani AG-1 IA]|uniref:Uncharacterized protein n=1 Tax=Thanatephorus cucumeris (strain AG1-IA) TaxID=983506 RepID=L8WYU7_THACA|nr:hypothetical protein AG1IA_02719 [Rhizoctonia solani AG-1 IA]
MFAFTVPGFPECKIWFGLWALTDQLCHPLYPTCSRMQNSTMVKPWRPDPPNGNKLNHELKVNVDLLHSFLSTPFPSVFM